MSIIIENIGFNYYWHNIIMRDYCIFILFKLIPIQQAFNNFNKFIMKFNYETPLFING